MSAEAIEIMNSAQGLLNDGLREEDRKTLKLESFQSFGDQRDGLMKVSVGKQQVKLKISDLDKSLQEVSSFVRQFDVQINTPMDEGYDLVPSVKNPQEMVRKTRASKPIAAQTVPMLVNAIREGEKKYLKMLADYEAEKAAKEKEPASPKADPGKEVLIARAKELGIDAKGTWGVPKLTAAIAEAEAAMTTEAA